MSDRRPTGESDQRPTDGGSPDRDGELTTRGDLTTWLLLEGNRLWIAAGLLAAILLALLVVLWAFGFDALNAESPMYFLFSSLLTGDLTLLTVVLSINQLVLARELGAPGNLRERIDRAVDYRKEVETATGSGAPPTQPPAFLRYLHEDLRSRADALADGASDVRDGTVRRRVQSLADALVGDARTVNGVLDRGPDRIFAVVSATLETNHAEQLGEIARLRDQYAGAIPEEHLAQLDHIEELLLRIDVARKYFRTVYVQKELAYLSRVLLYVGVPAIVASGLVLVLYNTAVVTTVPESAFVVGFVVAFTLGFAPLAVLFAFVLRLAWVAQQTATVAPFSPEPGYSP